TVGLGAWRLSRSPAQWPYDLSGRRAFGPAALWIIGPSTQKDIGPQVSAGVRRYQLHRDQGEAMKTYAFANRKGGVGKTTLALHFCHFLRERGAKVLLVDLDSQGNLSSTFGKSSCLASLLF